MMTDFLEWDDEIEEQARQVTRRRFFFLSVGSLVVATIAPLVTLPRSEILFNGPIISVGDIIAAAWEKRLGESHAYLFNSRLFYRTMQVEYGANVA